MKKKFKNHTPRKIAWLRLICLALCLMAVFSVAVGCGDKSNEAEVEGTGTIADTRSPSEPSTAAPETGNATDALKTYYESLISELRAELLKEREDRYISDSEYKRRLEELENALNALESATSAEDKPTVAPPETQAPETEPEETKPPEISATFNYRLENNEIIITAYKGNAVMVSIPTEIDGHPVTAIDDHAFQNTSVISVILPSTVKTVGWFAFYGCFALEIVSIPASVTSIDYAAFDGCPNLTVLCTADSYAAKYVVSFGLKHEYV